MVFCTMGCENGEIIRRESSLWTIRGGPERQTEVINEDPFLGQGGGAAGITFINSNLGFMALSHNGGDEAELYRTEDGGRTTTRVELPYSVMEEKPNPDEPFDFPSIPYEEDGTLKMLIGQGLMAIIMGAARDCISQRIRARPGDLWKKLLINCYWSQNCSFCQGCEP